MKTFPVDCTSPIGAKLVIATIQQEPPQQIQKNQAEIQKLLKIAQLVIATIQTYAPQQFQKNGLKKTTTNSPKPNWALPQSFQTSSAQQEIKAKLERQQEAN